MKKFAQSIIDQLLKEKKAAAEYAAGERRFGTPALAASFIEKQKLAEAEGEREKERQERKLAAEKERTQMTESGALERARLEDKGATTRTGMTVEGGLGQERLRQEGETGRTRMTTESQLEQERLRQEGALDVAELGKSTPMETWMSNAPTFMAELAKNELLTPEDRERAMQMYWQQALASSGQGLDFSPLNAPPSGYGSFEPTEMPDEGPPLASAAKTTPRTPRRPPLSYPPGATGAGATGAGGRLAAAGAGKTRRTPTSPTTLELQAPGEFTPGSLMHEMSEGFPGTRRSISRGKQAFPYTPHTEGHPTLEAWGKRLRDRRY